MAHAPWADDDPNLYLELREQWEAMEKEMNAPSPEELEDGEAFEEPEPLPEEPPQPAVEETEPLTEEPPQPAVEETEPLTDEPPQPAVDEGEGAEHLEPLGTEATEELTGVTYSYQVYVPLVNTEGS